MLATAPLASIAWPTPHMAYAPIGLMEIVMMDYMRLNPLSLVLAGVAMGTGILRG